MKRDQAETLAVANAVQYGLRSLPVVDVPQRDCLAPDFVIDVPKPARLVPVIPAPRYPHMSRAESRAFLRDLRDELARKASNGLYHDAADAEWRGLTIEMRQCLVRVAGIRARDKMELHALASRAWQEMPDAERESIKRVVRTFRTQVSPLSVLGTKV